jgi:hypothetical protein
MQTPSKQFNILLSWIQVKQARYLLRFISSLTYRIFYLPFVFKQAEWIYAYNFLSVMEIKHRDNERIYSFTPHPPILLVGRKARLSFKGAVSSNSEVLIFLKFSRYTNWKYTDATPRTDLEIGRKCEAFFAKGDH